MFIVYTTLAPKSTPLNATQQRRESEGLPRSPQLSSEPTSSSPTQQRHSSTSALPTTRMSAPSAEKPATPVNAQPALRTSLPPTSSPKTDPIPAASPITSPVMNETLSVIDEHMNDMNTPPGSLMNSKRNSTGINYSYITGHETDEEENSLHTEEEVLGWNAERVAEYLEDNGVEKAHCNVFIEQEISGEVLLAMEQSSLFLKEFALGSVGRRLRTWHKIRALQHEVRRGKSPEVPKQSFEYVDEDEELDAVQSETGRNRASTVGSALPRALDTSRQSAGASAAGDALLLNSQSAAPSTTNTVSPLQNITSNIRPEDDWKLSAQAIREKQIAIRQSRRRSGLGGDSFDTTGREGHRKQASIDESWQPGQPQANGGHSHTLSSDTTLTEIPRRESSLRAPPSIPSTPLEELDRAYYSSNETERRPATAKKPQPRKVPTSAASADVSRTNSSNRRSTLSGGFISSDVLRDSFSPTISQGIFGALTSVGSSIRSATSPQVKRKPTYPLQDSLNPVVTKLDYSASSDALTASPNTVDPPAGQRSTTSPKLAFFSAHKPKVTGLRTISDAITKNERLTASPIKDGEMSSPARTGSTTPSTETQSLELQKSEAHYRMSLGPGGTLVPPQSSQRKIKVKPKKATSAYTRGLEKKTPAQQIVGSDYSGWMKKKSGSLMTTWKTRLFILRGRRLSYYYSDGDTEEKGLIDISFHRVLPAHHETLTGLHAAVTGAAGSPSSPRDSMTQTAAQLDLQQKPAPGETNDGMFIFKLVPPKSGLAKGVNFTKPTVHYFAVNSRQEGRLWMAALMKATIDRDDNGMVTTTYNQKTISLAKARARRERPPALKDTATEDRAELDGEVDRSATGLGIGGLNEKLDAVAGAERGTDDASSIAPSTAAPSTVATGLESFYEKEPAAVDSTLR